MKRLIIFLIAVLISTRAFAQDSLNVTRMGLAQLPCSCTRLAVSGNFAYLGGDSLCVVDVSDPANPLVRGCCDPPGTTWNMAASGSYMYLANWMDRLRVVDASDPASPVDVGGGLTGLVVGVAVADSYAYVGVMDAGLRVLDISNPANPDSVGACELAGHPIGLTVGDYFLFSAWQHQGIPYYVGGLQMVNVVPPTAPTVISSMGFLLGTAPDVATSTGLAFVTFGLPEVRIIDVADPPFMNEVGILGLAEACNGLAALNARVYLAEGAHGLRVMDASNPVSPSEVGYYLTQGEAKDVVAYGDYLYVAEGNYFGVYEFTPPTAVPDYPPGSTPDAFNLAVSPNPFNSSATLIFDIPQAAHIFLRVFDLLGRQVAVLKDDISQAGSHRVVFDGSRLASGIYFARLEAGEFVQTRKLMLLK